MSKGKNKKVWYKRGWVITLFIFLGIGILGNILDSGGEYNSHSSSSAEKLGYDLEISSEELFAKFTGLSELQLNEKLKEFKGKRIKTSIYVSKVGKATLSSQYVVREMYEYPYNLISHMKAFFPAEEKDKLLSANIGDIIIFSGELVNYKQGLSTNSIEFTKSKVIEIKSGK